MRKNVTFGVFRLRKKPRKDQCPLKVKVNFPQGYRPQRLSGLLRAPLCFLALLTDRGEPRKT